MCQWPQTPRLPAPCAPPPSCCHPSLLLPSPPRHRPLTLQLPMGRPLLVPPDPAPPHQRTPGRTRPRVPVPAPLQCTALHRRARALCLPAAAVVPQGPTGSRCRPRGRPAAATRTRCRRRMCLAGLRARCGRGACIVCAAHSMGSCWAPRTRIPKTEHLGLGALTPARAAYTPERACARARTRHHVHGHAHAAPARQFSSILWPKSARERRGMQHHDLCTHASDVVRQKRHAWRWASHRWHMPAACHAAERAPAPTRSPHLLAPASHIPHSHVTALSHRPCHQAAVSGTRGGCSRLSVWRRTG